MAIEKKYSSIDPVAFTEDGQENGLITVVSTDCFKVGMDVLISSDTQPESIYSIKRVTSETQMFIGPEKSNIKFRSDMTAFLATENASIRANCQDRPSIPPEDYERAVYEEEPTVAKRVFNVDKYGKPFPTITNPWPTVDTAPDFEPTHFESAVATAGTPDTITIPGKKIQLVFVFNPNKGPSKNQTQDVLFITIDGSPQKTTVPRGASRYFPGTFDTLEVDTNNDGTNYEVIVWSEV